MNDKQAYDVVNEIVSCWIEQEKPLICGKQLITRSFFLKDFIGRKLITAMPETESNSWRLIFEGGHQLNIILFMHTGNGFIQMIFVKNGIKYFYIYVLSQNMNGIFLIWVMCIGDF